MFKPLSERLGAAPKQESQHPTAGTLGGYFPTTNLIVAALIGLVATHFILGNFGTQTVDITPATNESLAEK